MLSVWAACIPALGQGERSFSLSSSETCYPGQKPKVAVWAQNVGSLEFRVYRVNDPVRFFAQLQEQHRFGGQEPRARQKGTWLEKFHAWKHRIWGRIRDFVRAQFSEESRATIREWRLQSHVKSVSKVETYAQVPLLNQQQLVAAWRWAPTPNKQRWESDSITIPVQDAGVYLVEATDGELRAYTIVMVSEIALITKSSPGQLVNFVVDRKSGVPVANATVLVWANKQELARIQTDASGLAAVPVNVANPEDVSVLVRDGSRFAVNALYAWNLGTSPDKRVESYGYTDRPVYRPGDTMHFKFILRSRQPQGYQLPQAREVRVEITDANGTAKLQKTYAVSGMGTFNGDFTIPADAGLGYWSVGARLGEVHLSGASFFVEEYKKPEYQVRVAMQTSRVIQGQPIKATIDARYYFGEPVANAKVTWVVHRSRWWWPGRYVEEDSDNSDEEGESDYEYAGEQTLQQSGKLDGDGKLQITIPTSPDKDKSDLRLRIEARVTDEGNREIAGAGYAIATYASYYLDARPDSYVYQAGSTARIAVKARDYDEKPVQTPFHVELVRWSWQDKSSRQTVWTGDGRTDSNGEAEVQVPLPAAGQFRVIVKALSPEQREVEGSAYLWVPGATPWWTGGRRESLKIVADKKEYKPGDTAHIAVFGASDASHVLVSVEGSYLYTYQVVANRQGNLTVDVPIRREYAPNVYVSVVYIKDSKFYQGQKMLPVPPTEHLLKVELKPSKPQFQPGEQAVYRLRAWDANDRPAQGEFSLGVVDEAIYAIHQDTARPIASAFYGRVYDQVGTQSSLTYYFSGAAGKRKMQLANVRPSGSLAQLKPERLVQPKVRKAFPDTAYWVADVRTDAGGEAQVRFSFPDALTTWRATTRGITADSKVGSAVEKTIVRKNLMVRLIVPRFFRQGDEVTVSTIVHNYLPTDKTARVAMEFDGLQVLDGSQRDVQVASRAEVKVDWRVRALNAGQARVLGKALTNEESDAMELTLPIEPFGVKLADARSGAITEDGEQRSEVSFAPDAQPGSRSLQITVSPSVAGTLFGALDYLTSYPYGCTEQTMSSFLPNVIVAQVLKESGANAQVDPAELRKKVNAGLARLYDYQHEEGGWGWWKTDDSHVFMTAYVLAGLSEARTAGYEVRPDVMEKARKWLRQKLESDQKINIDQRAYAVYALTMSGLKDAPMLDAAWSKRGEMTPYGIAVLGLAMKQAGDARAEQLADTLEHNVKSDNQQAWWVSARDYLLDFSTDATPEATAFAVKFLSLMRPQSPLLPKAALYLVAHRDEGYYWTSTKQTAMVIFGLIDYVRLGGELKPDFTAEVYVGERKVLTRHFTAADATQPPIVLKVTEGQYGPGKNAIRVTKKGTGRLYWSARADYYSADRKLVNTGSLQLSLTREYFRLTPVQRDDKIVYRLDALPQSLQVGDVVAVRLAAGGSEWRYLMIEDPVPAGTESITRDDLYELDQKPNWWNWWYTERALHDDRTTFFQTWFSQGQHEYVYLLKVVNPGVFRVSPAKAEPMYQPNYMATSDIKTVNVK
jgi:hypothetical protein